MNVLDAWAAMAFLQGEVAAPRVRRALQDGAVISEVNLGEVLYTLVRRQGEVDALEAIGDLRAMLSTEGPSWELTRHAALIKAAGGLSYADAFAVATAQRHSAPLLTGDPEIIALDNAVEVIDLRKEANE